MKSKLDQMKKLENPIKEILRKKKAVQSIALKKGCTLQTAEDIAQDVVLESLEKPKRLWLDDYISFANQLREGKESAYHRKTHMQKQPDYESAFKKMTLQDLYNLLPAVSIDLEEREDFTHKVNALTSKMLFLDQRALKFMICYFFYGLTYKEIADFHGITPTRVFGILQRTLEVIKENIR